MSNQIGVLGLGVMGGNLARNFRDRDIRVSGYERDADILATFQQDSDSILSTGDLDRFVNSLERPRKILLMVKAGNAVDQVIDALIPRLEPGDCILDCGNSHYRDTTRRENQLAENDIRYAGVGVSGGAEGARNGPSIMVGASENLYAEIGPLLEPIAARADDGTPCAARVGPPAAGHFVKMVHNGIEYADMQQISEVWWLLKYGLCLPSDNISDVFQTWEKGELSSFLITATRKVIEARDNETGLPLTDVILDRAAQKGTGQWTTETALEAGIPTPTLATAVMARTLSSMLPVRQTADPAFAPGKVATTWPSDVTPGTLAKALLVGRLIALGQGFSLMAAADTMIDDVPDLAAIARIWRAGCIIQSASLNDVAEAADNVKGNQVPIVLNEPILSQIRDGMQALRKTVLAATAAGLPVPCLSASLNWLGGLASATSSASLIQGQRDFFGQHGFERRDKPGQFHHDWTSTADTPGKAP